MNVAPDIENCIAQYLDAARRWNNLIRDKQPVSLISTAEVAWCAMRVFSAYKMPSNLAPDGKPRVAIPIQLAADVARNIQRVLEGHIPPWMSDLTKRGSSRAHPRMREEIGFAVAYKKLCKAGLIDDRRSTKTISDLYGVTTRRVLDWMHEYSYAEPSDFCPAAKDEAGRAKLIQEKLPVYAAHYKQWGRSPRNARPHGKARHRPSAKS
jgi:hypothetical protein